MSINAMVLSLPTDLGRRRSCSEELQTYGISHAFVDGIDGSTIDETSLTRFYDVALNRRHFKRPLTRREVACSLGHQKIWRYVARSDRSITLVLEDDAIFGSNPCEFLRELVQCAELFEDVIVKLDGVSKGGKILGEICSEDVLLSDRLPARTTGYLLGRRAAARLAGQAKPIARPVDIDLKFYWEHKVPILTLGRQLIFERRCNTSNLETDRNQSKPSSPLRRFVRNLLYQARYSSGRLAHPLRAGDIAELSPLLRTYSRVSS